MLWLIPVGVGVATGAAWWFSKSPEQKAAFTQAGSKAASAASHRAETPKAPAPSAAQSDDCSKLLEAIANKARRITALPASVVDPLVKWAAHSNGSTVRILSADGFARLPQKWVVARTMEGQCMGERYNIKVWRPDPTGSALPVGAWVTIGVLIPGEGPGAAITGELGKKATKQLQADDRWVWHSSTQLNPKPAGGEPIPSKLSVSAIEAAVKRAAETKPQAAQASTSAAPESLIQKAGIAANQAQGIFDAVKNAFVPSASAASQPAQKPEAKATPKGSPLDIFDFKKAVMNELAAQQTKQLEQAQQAIKIKQIGEHNTKSGVFR